MAGETLRAIREEPAAESSQTSPRLSRLALLAVTLVVLYLGSVECWFGRLDYGSDAISYLDISTAVMNGDWKTAFNPLWGLGYPALIAGMRHLFAPGPAGEWLAVHFLNILILLAAWFAYLFFLTSPSLRQPAQAMARSFGGQLVLLAAAAAVFLTAELCIDTASRVMPDLLVACVVFLAFGIVARLLDRPTLTDSALLGAVMGVGYVTKAAFLPFSVLVVFLLAPVLITVRQRLSLLAVYLVAFSALAGPYAAGLSWAFGRFTLGESGSLNYAWHVNRLPKWVHWEGEAPDPFTAWKTASVMKFAGWQHGAPDFGHPIHPSRVVETTPAVMEFATPFRVTYPPFFNPPYWYEGYRKYFNIRHQIIALGFNASTLAQVIASQPVFYVLLALALFALRSRETRSRCATTLRANWLPLTAAGAGIALYLPVHLEGRYVAGFLASLIAIPLIGLLPEADKLRGRAHTWLLAILIVGLAAQLVISQQTVLKAVAHGDSYSNSYQWRVGMSLIKSGFVPGDTFASIGGPSYYSQWAHMGGLRIVSETATEADADRFWKSSPAAQQRTISAFQKLGVKGVVALDMPLKTHPAAGWQPIGETSGWIYRFPN